MWKVIAAAATALAIAGTPLAYAQQTKRVEGGQRTEAGDDDLRASEGSPEQRL
jgi:hypothetical protein